MDEICEKAKTLRLKTIAEQLPQVMDMAGKNNWPCLKTIAHLFDLEIEIRRQKRGVIVCRGRLEPCHGFFQSPVMAGIGSFRRQGGGTSTATGTP